MGVRDGAQMTQMNFRHSSLPDTIQLPEGFLCSYLGKIYYIDNGVLQVRDNPSWIEWERVDFMLYSPFQEQMRSYGYNLMPQHIPAFMDPLIGHTWEELVAEAKHRASRNSKHKAILERQENKWKKIKQQFNGMVTGIDNSYLNIHPAGFSVRVTLKEDSINNQRNFVYENRKRLLQWCIGEVKTSRRFMKQIGDMKYYTPSQMVVLQSNELEVFFSVKDLQAKENERGPRQNI